MHKSSDVRFSSRRWATVFVAVALPVAAAIVVAPTPRVFAGDCCGGDEVAKKDESKAQGLLVDLGNTKCPVMGGKPNGKTFSEWNGVRVGHCCGMCPPKFAANPEQYLKQTGIDYEAAAAAVKKVDEAKGADRDKALTELKKKWTVVREPAAVEAAATGTLIDLANAKCPVMGGDVDGKSYTDWNGLRIGHCCSGCSKKLLADPEKVLAEAKIEWKAAADAAKAVDAAKGADRAKALDALKKKWKVLREPAPESPAK